MIQRLRNLLTRVAAVVVLLAMTAGPPAAIALLIGRPWPAWDRLRAEIDRGQVSTDTTMKLAALAAIIVWAWAMVIITRDVQRVLRERQHALSPHDHAHFANGANRAGGWLQRLVRIAIAGTLSTAATISTLAPSATALTTNHPTASPITRSRPAAMVVIDHPHLSTRPLDTIVADGRHTPLSLAVDLGDESLRDEIITLNQNAEWSAGVFPAGMEVLVPRPANTPAVDASPPSPSTTTVTEYVVQPGDGLWDVSEALLGDGSRYHELHEQLVGQQVAPGVIYNAQTRVIHPGWVFTSTTQIAVTAPTEPVLASTNGTYLVRAGDTLSSIAAVRYGHAEQWSRIWGDNAGHDMGAGRTFDDPNLILPGWSLLIPNPDVAGLPPGATSPPPNAEPADLPAAETPMSPSPAADAPLTPAATGVSAPPPPAATASTPTSPASSLPTADDSLNAVGPVGSPAPATGQVTGSAPGFGAPPIVRSPLDFPVAAAGTPSSLRWIEGLSGSTVLASGLIVMLRRRRRRNDCAALGDEETGIKETSPLEAVLIEAADVDFVRWAGLALGELGAQLDPAQLRGDPAELELDTETGSVELHWTTPNPLPVPGWEARDGGWSWLARFDETAVLRELAPPMPSLVTVGSRGSRLVMIDLEQTGSLAVAGDPELVSALLRSVVLELASGDHLTDAFVVTVGSDLTALAHLDRVRTVDIDEAAEILKRSVDDRADMVGDAGSLFRARLAGVLSVASPTTVVIAAGLRPDERDRLVAATSPGRGAALIVAGAVEGAGAQLHVDRGGGLYAGVSGHRVRLDPVGVPSSTAVELCGWLNRELTEPLTSRHDGAQVPTRSDHAAAVQAEHPDALDTARIETSFVPTPALTPSVEPVRRFTLRVFGDVAADGASTQALAVPFALAFARRAMSSAELAEITGYSLRTFSTVFTTDHPLVRRVDGRLTLREGVWTDHGWIAECVRHATRAGASGGVRWLHQAIEEASKITGAPFGSLPAHRMKRDPYAWVDDFPVDVSARVQAGQELVEAVLAAVELWMVGDVADVVPASQLVRVCCRLAELVPYAPVADQVRPSPWQSAGEALLVAGYRIGSGDHELQHAVQSQAKRLVATEVIEASDQFADELGL